MFRLDLICLTNSGISAARITTVRPMIDSTHAAPPSGSRTRLNSQCHPTRIAEMTKYRGVRMKWPRVPRGCTGQAPWVGGEVADGAEGMHGSGSLGGGGAPPRGGGHGVVAAGGPGVAAQQSSEGQ